MAEVCVAAYMTLWTGSYTFIHHYIPPSSSSSELIELLSLPCMSCANHYYLFDVIHEMRGEGKLEESEFRRWINFHNLSHVIVVIIIEALTFNSTWCQCPSGCLTAI